ncbi:MAG TPA: gephyrin-like molybdotransferase Glp [Bacteroidales bacterium]
MIEFDEAFGIVMKSGFETESETISFNSSYGRILDEDIASDMDMPPFNRSAMDGYACHRTDLSSDLEIVEVIAAGKEPAKMVGKNQCSKVMTGAIVPDTCDTVIMIEETINLINGKIRYTGNEPKLNISFKGEDIRSGDIVLRKGKFIHPQDIAVMASVGSIKIMVKRRPKVGILSTGDELVEPSVKPGISQIRNSNAYQLMTQVVRAGGAGTDYGIAPDNEAVTFKIIEKAINENDIVIITGGVSIGDFDFVPLVLEQAGVKILFDQVNVQPGKPTTFGIHPKAIVFGLPGNPVSSFIQFELLVRPLISSMMGHHWIPDECKLPMSTDYKRKSSVRLGFIPVTINNNKEVIPVPFHGSAHITALSYSDGIIAMKPGTKSLEKGEIVNVRQI